MGIRRTLTETKRNINWSGCSNSNVNGWVRTVNVQPRFELWTTRNASEAR